MLMPKSHLDRAAARVRRALHELGTAIDELDAGGPPPLAPLVAEARRVTEAVAAVLEAHVASRAERLRVAAARTRDPVLDLDGHAQGRERVEPMTEANAATGRGRIST
jgi:hypothetical protein